MQKITTCLWFDDQAEEAVNHYLSVFGSVFGGGSILDMQRYGESGPGPEGSVMVIRFEIAGQELLALNGGPAFTFSEAVSLSVDCATQEEVDELWARLTEGGEESQCGWLKDKYGLSWQIVPRALPELLGGPDGEGAQRVMRAMMEMKKIDIARLEAAYRG
ncbi:VOC family protein [Streptomyces sp. NPDC053542]|uniref:VOC family protein n=1 Tax=Streptomyces sp. NPDC053542 TaxID=3365710 RepID=UPI0037D54EB7